MKTPFISRTRAFAAFLLLSLLTCVVRPQPAPVPDPNDPTCGLTPEALKYLSPSTMKMVQLLTRLARETDPNVDVFDNRKRAELFRAEWIAATNTPQAVSLRTKMAVELLNAGETESAIRELEGAEADFLAKPSGLDSRFRAELHYEQAVAWLRLGEQQNCLLHHGSASCIFPIRGEGIYKEQAPSQKGLQILEAHLRGNPKDLRARWLLNLAYMTLGQYPDKVPAQWLIPPSRFASDYDIKTFNDIAPELGLDIDDCAGGTIAEDFDGDGFIDLMTSEWSPTGPMHYFRNNGDGTFTDKTMEAGLSGLVLSSTLGS